MNIKICFSFLDTYTQTMLYVAYSTSNLLCGSNYNNDSDKVIKLDAQASHSDSSFEKRKFLK